MTTSRGIAYVLLFLSWTALAEDHQSKNLVFTLPNVPAGIMIDGQRFDVPLTGRVHVEREDETLRASVTINADLASLQKGLPGVMRRRVNRNDNCNEIIDIHTITLSPESPSLRVEVAAHYEDWECPWTEVLGQRVSLPPQRLFEQNGSATFALMPETNGNSVAIRVDVRKVDIDGFLGNLLRTDVFGPLIRDVILQSVPRMIDVGNIEQQLPAALKGLPIRLTNVSFVNRDSSSLGLRVEATITAEGRTADVAWEHLQ